MFHHLWGTGVVIALSHLDGRELMKANNDFSEASRYEITLRAIGQALEALGVETFELVLDGDSFIVYGGTDVSGFRRKVSTRKFRLFHKKPEKLPRRGFYISGMRFRPSDIKRLDRQGRDIRIAPERFPETSSLAHALRMIGAHIDKTGLSLLAVVGNKGLFTVWHRTRSGEELKQIFTGANLYDLWVHLYKQRDGAVKRTGTTNS